MTFRNNTLLKSMETRLRNLKHHPDSAIFRVPHSLREVYPSAYEPMFVSIGPYHYKPLDHDQDKLEKPKLQQGQDLKWHFLQDFLGRNDEVSLADYIRLIQGLELDARKCYVEDVSLDSNKFNQVMLLDACFILEFFLKQTSPEEKYGHRNYKQHGNNMGRNCINIDLLLLENQLPLFIIEEIYSLFTRHGHDPRISHSLRRLAYENFKFYLCKSFGKINFPWAGSEEGIKLSSKYYHLVHLVHAHLFRSDDPTPVDNNYDQNTDRSASTLHAMGVKIVRPQERSLFEISFDNGTLQLPRLHIFDSTSQVLRNFIAFEQSSAFVPHYFSPYALFMDELINTVRDVDTLQEYGVLTSHIGSNESVANLFNQIGIGCIKDDSKNYLHGIQTQLQEYCKVKRHQWKAKLVHDYFSSPWSILSLVGALLLLLLTALQTIFTVRS